MFIQFSSVMYFCFGILYSNTYLIFEILKQFLMKLKKSLFHNFAIRVMQYHQDTLSTLRGREVKGNETWVVMGTLGFPKIGVKWVNNNNGMSITDCTLQCLEITVLKNAEWCQTLERICQRCQRNTFLFQCCAHIYL